MKIETLKRIFDFIKKNEGIAPKYYGSLEWKILFNEPFTKEDLNVKGDLDLNGSNILSLPDGLKVNGYLDLSNTWINSLPKGLEVASDLNLDYTMIDVLPKGLKVYGDLSIRRTRLKKYTYDELIDMVKPGFILGKILI